MIMRKLKLLVLKITIYNGSKNISEYKKHREILSCPLLKALILTGHLINRV